MYLAVRPRCDLLRLPRWILLHWRSCGAAKLLTWLIYACWCACSTHPDSACLVLKFELTTVVQGHLLAPYAVKDRTLLNYRPLLASYVMQAISLQLLVQQHYAECAVTHVHQARQQEQAPALSVPKDGTPITLVLPQPVLHVVLVSIPQPLRQPAKGRASTAMLVHIKVFGVYRLVLRVQRARFRLEGVHMHV